MVATKKNFKFLFSKISLINLLVINKYKKSEIIEKAKIISPLMNIE
jgi:hypothetical protein